MIIAQISDSHIDPAHDSGPARLGDLEACVDDINALDPAPDLVIHTGDMAHNGDGEKYRLALGILKKLKKPLFICAGNRDERSLLAAQFASGHRLMPDAPYVQYAVDDFPVRLIALDTLSAQSNQGDFCPERADNLRRILATDVLKPTVVFMHHPPFEITESKYPRQYEQWESAERLAGVLKDNSQVVRGFCGHSHRHATGTVAGIPFSTAPSVARDLRLGDFAPDMSDFPVYHLHTFDGKSAFRTEIRPARTHALTE